MILLMNFFLLNFLFREYHFDFINDFFSVENKMKNKNIHTVEIVKKYQQTSIERSKIHRPHRSLSPIGTGCSIKSGTFNYFYGFKLSEMMRSFSCIRHVSKVPTPTDDRANSVVLYHALILGSVV